jgi:hypothetical protein
MSCSQEDNDKSKKTLKQPTHQQLENTTKDTSVAQTGSSRMVESPTKMDFETREQGKEMHEVLKLFKTTTISPMSSCILQMPKHKRRIVEDNPKSVQGTQRRSPSLSAKKKNPQENQLLGLPRNLLQKNVALHKKMNPLMI